MFERQRAVYVVAAALLVVGMVCWAARPVLEDPAGILWGAEVDSVLGAWAHWWRAQPGAQGDVTRWVSFPSGERGALLYPLGHLLVSQVQRLWGPVAAHNLLAGLYLLLAVGSTGLLAAHLARDARAGVVAALAALAARPLLAHVGLGNIEGLAAAWTVLLLWMGLRWERGGLLVGLVAGVSVLENPYCLPVTAVMALALAWRRGRRPGGLRQVAQAAVTGATPVLLWLWHVGGVVGGTDSDPRTADFLGLDLRIYEESPGAQALQLIWPWPNLSFEFPSDQVLSQGGGVFLGWVAAALAFVGAVTCKRARVAVALAALAGFLALGSFPWGPHGPPGLFWLVDLLLDTVAKALSQPVRYSVFAALALAVGAGLGAAALCRRCPRPWTVYITVSLLISAEALALGGPSMEVPGLDTRGHRCLARVNGPVHTVLPPHRPDQNVYSYLPLLLQLAHRQPGTHRGIGGWPRLPRSARLDRALEELDHAVLRRGKAPRATALAREGLRWVVAPAGAIGAGAFLTCDAWSAAPLERYLPASAPPTSHQHQRE